MSSRGKGKTKGNGQRTSQSEKAGPKFPVARIKRYLKLNNYSERIGGVLPCI